MRATVTTRTELREDLRPHGPVPFFLALLIAACGESPSDTCSGYEKDSSGEANTASVPADDAPPPSCSTDGPGLTDCGDDKESCCKSLLVQGGTFYRTYTNDEGCTPQDNTDLSTLSSFRLDKYAATVGRFRQFVEAWNGGWRPDDGSGKHGYLNGGEGLDAENLGVEEPEQNGESATGHELGWVLTNDDDVSLTTEDLTSCSGSNLLDDVDGPNAYKRVFYACNTWTHEADVNERLPIVCVNWPEAYAFCIWDGGFLPSDAELRYAAAGGSQQRKYPWGPAEPGRANRYAIYDCNYPTPSLCTSASKMAPVGTASSGAGRWGQLDLVGNVRQWSLDGYTADTDEDDTIECNDCSVVNPEAKSIRGGGFESTAFQLNPTDSWPHPPSERRFDTGFRCARTP